MIGLRLRRARLGAKLSLRELSSAMSGIVTAQAIGRYENNVMMPSSNVLIALSKALGVTAEYLLGDDQVVVQGVAFRRGANQAEKLSHSIEAKILDYVQRYVDLAQLIEIDRVSWKHPKDKGFKVVTVDDAENAADVLRAQWNLGTGPIMSVAAALEAHAIRLIATDLPAEFSGTKAIVKIRKAEFVPVIVVNKSQNAERQRFTYAHELAHLILEFAPSARAAFIEKASDRFAGAFLVNSQHLAERLGGVRTALSFGELIELKRYFRVSLASLVVRCRQADLISQSLYTLLWDQVKQSDLNSPSTNEPFAALPDLPSQLERMCLFAVSEQLISESKAAEILQISTLQLNERLSSGPPSAAVVRKARLKTTA
jgi:Zn-dependent peptidase ImmA (M78 family)/transcriptional regulator with XRE-family HTH domain